MLDRHDRPNPSIPTLARGAFYLLVAVYAGTLTSTATGYRPDTALFPIVVGVAVAGVLVAKSLAAYTGIDGSGVVERFSVDTDAPADLRGAGVVFGWVGGFVCAVFLVGLIPATTALTAGFVYYYEREPATAAIAGGAVLLLSYGLFAVVLGAPGYGGLLAEHLDLRPLV